MHDDHDVKQRARPFCTALTIVDLLNWSTPIAIKQKARFRMRVPS